MPAISFADEAAYTDGLLTRASEKRLSEKRPWQVLLHYKHTYKGYKSLIDDKRFFLAPDGQTSPGHELEATIKGFFRTDVTGDAHPRCKFVARFNWLKDELDIDEKKLPQEDCKGYDELMTALKPDSAVLIFPVAHINSPASMFGHTLLRIDSGTESKLISYAANYSAVTGENNGIAFAFKGIFGYYEGYFFLMPYYEKIKEYANMENRDMWEYRLNLTKIEVKKVVDHMWELKDIYSYYYFFDENCSYNLLLALEAARPEVRLTDSLPAWVIPMDTIRSVRENGYFTDESHYRPSKATRIKFIEGLSGADDQQLAIRIALGETGPEEAVKKDDMDRDARIRTLDMATEYLQYRFLKKKIEKDDYQKRYLNILSVRSTLGKGAEYDIPVPVNPEAGHGSARLGVGAGVKAGASYASLTLRPANHDLMDPDQGYLEGAGISFLDGELRYNFTESKLSLERLTIIKINSVAPMDRFFKPISWQVSTGVVREEFSKREHRTVFDVNGGPGTSVKLGGALLYAFAGAELKAGAGLDRDYSIGVTADAGAYVTLTDRWKAQLGAKAADYEVGDRHRVYSGFLNQRYTINRDNALRLDLTRERFSHFYSSDVRIIWNRYF